MSFVWKRLQRVNKRAVKYRVLFELKELVIEGCSKWQPDKVIVVFSRRNRRKVSQPMSWEPTIRNPYLGMVKWSLPEIIDIEITLFKDSHNRFESKEWIVSIESISQFGKNRRIATANINISNFVDCEQFSVPLRHELSKMKLNLVSKKVKLASISLTMATQFLKEGKATDDDMQSLASLMSMTEQNPPIDLDDDLDENQSNQTAEEISKMLKQFNEFLNNEGNEINENSENKIQSDTVGENLIVNTVENDLDKSISNENIHQKSESENVSATTHDDENLNESLTKGSEIPTSDSQHEEKNPDNAEEFNGSIDSLHDTDKNIVTSETNIKYSDDFTEVNDMDLSLLENIDLETEKFNNLAFPSTTSDLLSWCQSIAKHYSGVEITNMTTSWRNGIAFCAIIHHFRPDLIDFDSLQPSDIVGNCRKAFEAAESIGITKLIDPNQMATLNVPDKLSVMTYLYQLRSYFTDPLFNFQPSKLNSTQSDDQYLNQNQIEYDEKSTIDDSSKSPNNPSRSIGEKTIENESLLLKPMIQKQLTYPFQKNLTLKELDDDQKQETNEKLPKSHTLCDNEFRPEKCSISSPKKFKKICDDLVCNGNKSETTLNENRLQKLQKEARVLWANYQNNQFKTQRNDLNEKRIESLQRRAKKLISDSQKGLLNANSFRDSIDSLRNGHNGLSGVIPNNRSAMRSVEFANRTNDDLKAYRASNNSIKTLEFNFYQFKPTLNTIETNEAKKSPESSKSNDVKTSRNILKKINDVKLSPENLREELINIEDEQKRIDREASILEKRLRKLMESGGDQQLEERLIQNWFVLVNRRNSIIRRQMQLNIREKEADMNQQYEELSNKLRNLMVVEDSHKTSEHWRREKELLAELMKIVDKRNELVHHLDSQEKAIEEDELVESQTERSLPIMDHQINDEDKNCIIH